MVAHVEQVVPTLEGAATLDDAIQQLQVGVADVHGQAQMEQAARLAGCPYLSEIDNARHFTHSKYGYFGGKTTRMTP